MARTFPRGWFEGDLLWWGGGLGPGACLSRGAEVEIPDLRSADNRTILDLRSQNLQLLAALGSGHMLQVHWAVEDDYEGALCAYAASKQGAGGWGARACAVRRAYYGRRLEEGTLRRERVHAYLGRACTHLGPGADSSLSACEAYLAQAGAELQAHLRALANVHGLARWSLLDQAGHALHARRFLNPSVARTFAESGSAAAGVDPTRSVRANCMGSDVEAFPLGARAGGGCRLVFDGQYHALFVMRELPRGTRPGMILSVLDAVDRCAAVTVAVRPVPVGPEIERLRREIDQLSAFLRDRRAAGVENDIRLRRERIDSLMASSTLPFALLAVVRVWGPTEEAIAARALAMRTALQGLDGASFMQVANAAQARSLFYETLPGHFGTDCRGWDIYVENHNLADLLPFSSTFTGQLDGAQALYDSPGGGLVGLRLVTPGGTPQHTVAVGVNGSGKTAFLIDLLSQADAHVSYRFFQEEGLGLATLAGLCGMDSIVLRESGDVTLNPFDPLGLPLTAGSLARVVRTCMRLVGVSRDEDRNRRREGLIGEYAAACAADAVEDWRARNEDAWMACARRAVAARALTAPGDDFLDGCLALRELERTDPERARERLASVTQEQVSRLLVDPATAPLADAVAYGALGPGACPRFEGLVSLMRHGRLPHHRGAAAGDELDFLSSELAKGLRHGGVVGAFLDGVTNVDLGGRGVHLDTSRLPEGTLKDLAGGVVFEHVRHHILTLPRAQSKVMLLDELRRILLIPGAREFVKELLAQMRKYRCVFIGAFQEPSQIDDIDPALTDLLLGQCKQFFLMRQSNADQVARLGRSIGLPAAAQRAILRHPLVEHQASGVRASYFTYFSAQGRAPLCGTVRVEVDPAMLYVAESSGSVFDTRQRALAAYPSLLDGVLAESSRRP
jgi:type IV secretion system protein TrbE